jgi:S1-C subfamily serine protease
MLKSAARVGLAFLIASGSAWGQMPVRYTVLDEAQLRQTPSQDQPTYRQLLPSIVTLIDDGRTTGAGVLIDRSGLYIAHRSSVQGPEMQGRFWNGTVAHLHVVAQDRYTQLVLLRSDYVPPEARPVSAPAHETDPGTPLLVMLDGGSVRARIEAIDKIGLELPTNRIVPLTEIRFETPTGLLGGALLFTESGEFVGVLNATLARRDRGVMPVTAGAVGGGAYAAPMARSLVTGPADMTVAYTPGVDVIRHVFGGFLSPTHDVEHASIGILCRDGVDGALITTVQTDSPAEKAGLKPEDMIIGIGNYRIRNQLDFAKVMLRVQTNDKVLLRVDRGGRLLMRAVVVGKTAD